MLGALFKKKMIDQIAVAVQLDPAFAGYRVAPEAIEFGQENKGVAV
jgi:pyridoxine/pyridoxamine 5'-phosphate oxidase